jgi:hypothetical protein
MGIRKLIVKNIHIHLFAKQNEGGISSSGISKSKDDNGIDYICPSFNSIEFYGSRNKTGY